MEEQIVVPAREGRLRYTGEVRQADVVSLRDFLTFRSAALDQRHLPGSEESRTAQAVGVMVEVKSALLLEAVSLRDELLSRGEETARSRLDTCLREITEHWTVLMMIADHWRDSPGFDARRWRLPRYSTPEQEGVMAWLGFPWSPR